MSGCRDLSGSEISAVLKSFKGRNRERNRALVLVGINTGFRVSELCALTIGDVVDEYGNIVAEIDIDRKRMKGKKRGRSVPVNSALREVLYDYLQHLAGRDYILKTDPLFPTYGRKPLDRIGAWKIINRAKRNCRLAGKVATHSMRKTFATRIHDSLMELVAKGEKVDVLYELMEIIGHSDPKATIAYLRSVKKRKNLLVELIGVRA